MVSATPYRIKVSAWQGTYSDPSQVATHIFEVTITNLCTTAFTLTAPPPIQVPTQTYVLTKAAVSTTAFGECTKGPTYCP